MSLLLPTLAAAGVYKKDNSYSDQAHPSSMQLLIQAPAPQQVTERLQNKKLAKERVARQAKAATALEKSRKNWERQTLKNHLPLHKAPAAQHTPATPNHAKPNHQYRTQKINKQPNTFIAKVPRPPQKPAALK